jgi:DNA-binding PadR family transcriptional regulator
MKESEKKQTDLIGPFEQLVLTAIVALGERAYGLIIHERVAELGNRSVRVGAIYTTLERMEEKRYITSRITTGTARRAGRTRRVYTLTERGETVLLESAETARRVYETVDDFWSLGKWKSRRMKK